MEYIGRMVVDVAIKNRIKYWRHYLQIDTQREFAELLGVPPALVSLWERQAKQPSTENLYQIWLTLRQYIPEINMQDLIGPE